MNKKNGTKICFIAAAIALLVVAVAFPAGAGGLDRRLYGDYTYNISGTCVYAACGSDCQSDPGFQPGTLIRLHPGNSSSYNGWGVVRFDGPKKFTLIKGEVIGIRISPPTNALDIPVTIADLNC
jgi:hypothetical protein